MESTTATAMPEISPASALVDCLRLLRGERDEQKLAGLLVAANLCRAGDADAVAEVYRAVGPRFLRRLLMTGMGKGEGGKEEEREAYLRLAVTVLAALARVPDVAAAEGVVSAVPLVAEVVSKSSDLSIVEECYELLSLIAIASEDGSSKFYEPGVIDMLCLQISSLPEGSRCLELAVRLLQLLVHKLTVDNLSIENLQGMTSMVSSLARLFAVLHNAVKFDVLHMLTELLSLKDSPLSGALCSMSSTSWAAQICVGITAVLQNRVVSSEKLQALLLADHMMSILGENWLLENYNMQDEQDLMPIDKFVLLVLESARIEAAVLLNEIAYLKYASSRNSSNTEEAIIQKQGSQTICESTIMKAISGLNETISLVLDFLQDSKDHGERKGDDLLAAVRIIGSYLAEAPDACKENITQLLEYILSIEGQDETSPFYSICFMLPMLSQITTEAVGCRTLASFGGYRTVIDCLVKMTQHDGMMIDKISSIFLACDTILNFLSNKKDVHIPVDAHFVYLLEALVAWAGTADDSNVVMTASSLCTLVLDLTSEEFLLSCSDFSSKILGSLSQLIVRSLHQGITEDDSGQFDQKQLIVSGYKRWADRFPTIRNAVQHASLP